MVENIEAQKHAIILARDYNLADFDNLKSERTVTPETDINSFWLATKNRDVRCHIQYHQDELEE